MFRLPLARLRWLAPGRTACLLLCTTFILLSVPAATAAIYAAPQRNMQRM
jgi:hypothetical protein